MLMGQCKAWGGPLSVAVYLPIQFLALDENYGTIYDLRSKLDELHEEAELEGLCTMDIVLLTEPRSEQDAWAYPYNANRNQAIARVKTKLLLLLDVDFLPNKDMRKDILRSAMWKETLIATHERNEVFVLPAFETGQSLTLKRGLKVAKDASSTSKEGLKDLFDSGKVTRFAPFFKKGHGATDYTKWFRSSKVYEIEVDLGYEPFILMSRSKVPWFDERFRGYGWDKIIHIHHLAKSGFQFVVHPSAWVVHRPHAPSQAYSKTFTGPAYTSNHKPTEELKKLDAIAKEVRRDIRAGLYPKFGVSTLQVCNLHNLLIDERLIKS